ncbi:MAG: hypothetical protein IPF42_09425 [Candidatus Microthrix sp.]|nr:hypothetical protein [Candidatus Microthrix sp.]
MSDEPCEASMTGHPSAVWRNVLPTQMYPSGIKFRFDVFMPASDDLKHSCVDSHKIELQDFVDLWGTRNRTTVGVAHFHVSDVLDAAELEGVTMDVVDDSSCDGVDDDFHCFIDFRRVEHKPRRRAVAQRLHLNSEYVAASPATIE